jgi:hypothetical protein
MRVFWFQLGLAHGRSPDNLAFLANRTLSPLICPGTSAASIIRVSACCCEKTSSANIIKSLPSSELLIGIHMHYSSCLILIFHTVCLRRVPKKQFSSVIVMQESHHEPLLSDDEINLLKLKVFNVPVYPPMMSDCCLSVYHPSPPIDQDGMYCLSSPPYLVSMPSPTLPSPFISIPMQPSTFDTRLSSEPASTSSLPTLTTFPSQRSFTGMSTQHNGFGNQAEQAMRSSCEVTIAGNQGKCRGRTTASCPYMHSFLCLN